jgi:oxygen-independent coproporphyrinogen III oxidase
MPDAEERLDIFLDSLELLVAQGYAHLGLDHFARPDDELAVAHREGRMHRDFLGYTARPAGDLLGLGASAIGELGGAFLQNVTEERDFCARVAVDGLACARGHLLAPEDRLRRDVILGLMCRGRVERAAIEREHGLDFAIHFAPELEALAPFAADGLIELGPHELRVTPRGQLFLRNLAAVFDTHLRARQQDRERSYSRTH